MHIQFTELPVFDQDRAKKFYARHFRCEVVADVAMGADGWRWIELKLPGAETNLHFLRRKDDAPSVEPVLVFVDDDVERARHRRVPRQRGKPRGPWEPMTRGDRRSFR
jgi:predicted enzyme related to lactoylglutathione lyase